MTPIEARARALIGTRFRLHGRDPATGLDCIGVVACAAGIQARTGYALRGGDPREIEAALRAAGFVRVGDAASGDILVCRPGVGQLHLGVKTATGVIQADLALRRVIERPGPPQAEVIGTWRRLS
jgi:hypothetical protein